MDLVCLNCGEPWEVYYVVHEEPEAFQREDGAIKHCPCCKTRGRREVPNRDIIRALADVLGDDLDGLASTLEDFGS